jgi:hypothetical protein
MVNPPALRKPARTPSQPEGKQHRPAIRSDAKWRSRSFPGHYPVLEITATVEPLENAWGFSLRVHQAAKPRTT